MTCEWVGGPSVHYKNRVGLADATEGREPPT